MYENKFPQVNTSNLSSVPQKPFPSEEMARMVFNDFDDIQQVEVAKQFLSCLLELRRNKYESFVNESRDFEQKAQLIAEGNQYLAKLQ